MNWNDLKLFLAIAEAGTLAGAATRLRQNHSTVFRRLNTFEESLGVRLFERLPTGYQLTSAGQRMLGLAQEADARIQQIELELAGEDYSPEGLVRITAASNIARTLLPPVLVALRKEHPGIQVEISIGDGDYDLNRREADIALRATLRPPQHLIGKRLSSLSWWLCGRKDRSRNQPKTLEDIQDKPLIGADATLMRLPVFQWLEANYQHAIVARANDLSTMAALTCAGVGYSVLPSDQQDPKLQPLIQLAGHHSELWLLTHPELRHVQRIRAVWDAVVAGINLPTP